MRLPSSTVGLALLLCLVAFPRGVFAQTITAGGLALGVDDAGRVARLEIGGKDVMGQAAPAALVELADVTRGPSFVPGTRTAGDLAAGLALTFEGLEAAATLAARALEPGAVRFQCRLVGSPDAAARGVVLRFAFPVDAVGWRWHDDMQTSRVIAEGQTYENVRPLREWPDLPEWADQPSLRMGAANRNFSTVLTGPAGLCLAVPIDKPCIFRTAYDAGQRRLHLMYDLTLSPDTLDPNQWTFEFDLYPCDPEWGFRGALDVYYRLYPELFTNHVEQSGQWMAFSKLSQIDNVNEFLFGVQWGAPEVDYDDRIGVPSVTYLTHAGQFASIPGHDPETEPLPGHEVLVQTMTEAFRRTTGDADMFSAVALYDAEGKPDIRATRAYGHIIAQFNMAPQLPYGKRLLERAAENTARIRQRTGGELDGFGYDGLCTGLNYRADHFRHSVAPPFWDPVAKKPLLNNHFDSCAFARSAAESFRERGQISVMNGALHASFFVAPWLDVFGAETGLRIPREAFNYVRSISRHKPVLTLLKGNFEQVYGRDEIELFMKRALAYGVFPGFFDWSTSALGPGGRYWDHPRYYERDRDLFRRYLPLVQTLAMAGWEPVTHARSSDQRVFVERVGPGADGIVWLTLLNEGAGPCSTTLTVNAAALQLDPDAVECEEVLDGRHVALRANGGRLEFELDVESNGVSLVRLSTPAQAAAWRLAQARDVMQRGIRMREVDAGKPPLAVSWHPDSAVNYLRETRNDGHCLVLRGDSRGAQSAWQWAMLFQPEPAPVTLRVRAAGENLEGQGPLRVRARHAWVSPSFSYYDNQYLDLPKGTYEEQDFELTITPTQPLRAIQLQPEMGADVTGTLRITSITLHDRFRDDYVHNSQFHEWYEPVPESLQDHLAAESDAVRQAVEAARAAALDGWPGETARDLLFAIGARTTALRQWVDEQKAHESCRRVLRDVETVEQHLSLVTLAAFGLSAPILEAPSRVAVGDSVAVRVLAPTQSDVPIRTRLRVEGAAAVSELTAGPDDWSTLQIRGDAGVGDRITLVGEMLLGPEGRAVSVLVTRELVIAPPLEAEVASLGTSGDAETLGLAVTVRNNLGRRETARITVNVPTGWTAPAAVQAVLEPREEKTLRFDAQPGDRVQGGPVALEVQAVMGGHTARTTASVLHIPPTANLVRNPSFENGLTGWGGLGNFEIDTQTAHRGKASLRLHNAAHADRTQVSQTVILNQTRPAPVLIRAASRAEHVSGNPGRAYALYVDIYFADDSPPLYGQIHPFPTGTRQWQTGELVIQPDRPIRSVNLYLLLRNVAGTVWFDDVAMMQAPRPLDQADAAQP